ncbi:MAG: DUF192 domain-containing protein [Eggerthellaceae bacterium]|nr:DUF192 domain-containing protein [Eggerthellaceae bacterium]
MDGTDAYAVKMLTSRAARLRGLLFRRPDEVVRMLVPCRDVHTCLMRRPIDIAFLSQEGVVLEVVRGAEPMRRFRHAQAAAVVERFARDGPWLAAGQTMRIKTKERERA